MTTAMSERRELGRARTLVIKVGSSLLASLGGGLDTRFIFRLVGELAALRDDGRRVVLVSSGAVASGCVALGLAARPTELARVQAAAAVGQAALMQLYREAFAFHHVTVGQVLLTRDALEHRRRYLHARNTMMTLLDLGVLPVVNENDTVAVEELKLKMGDNDALAVSAAQLVEADALIILSDVPGLYDRPPTEAEAELVGRVEAVTPDVLGMAGGSRSGVGSGGMATKLLAARAATAAGIPLVVADGKRAGVLRDVIDGQEVGTFFAPRAQRASARRHWIAFGRAPDGALVVDEGARAALVEGKRSLLPVGVRRVDGEFEEGDTVRIVDEGGREIARGLCNFSAPEARRIAGRHGDEIGEILGGDCADTMVHRDNLVML